MDYYYGLWIANDEWMNYQLGDMGEEEEEEEEEEGNDIILSTSEESSPDVIANRLSAVIQAPSFASPGPIARSVPYGYQFDS